MKQYTTSKLALSVLAALGTSMTMAPVHAAKQQPLRAPTDQPNVILILADDLGIEGISQFGGEYYSPNINKLARNGISFNNAHATPLSSPTRTRLMTGIENRKNYKAFAYLDPNSVTFANTFKNAGYTTAITGKWQLSGNGFDGLKGITPSEAGFDQSLVYFRYTRDSKGSRYWAPTLYYNDKKASFEEGFGPDMEQKFVKSFISKNKDKPFLLYYPMVLTHNPFVVTPDSMNAKSKKDKLSGMITYMDKLVGDLVDYVDQEGLSKNTIFVFVTDNGTHPSIVSYRYGHKVRGGKGHPTINGTHVPLVFSWPGQLDKGVKKDALFDIMDVYPTISKLAGLKVKQEIDGVDQVPVLKGQKESVRDTIFMHYSPVWKFKPTSFIFNKEWKLYHNGKFVKLDTKAGTETVITEKNRTAESDKQLAYLKAEMAKVNDTPLDPHTSPWCVGQESLKKGVSALIAGCDMDKAGMRPAKLEFLD
ncbi:Arylsulfatase precursor [Vibrio ruber DSM 16370]|uniref:Arylsulfatase n=1 Tax=Vibrio ruber (strain DSM 16370 / JCM 11486 / BCRC 17186 / CECT 7878 / LMG 23124 / VR1) TaxID=1123498 RepID=A0A1R4LN85_VIBR1|nr:sulfatase-like hydrolase/transferase [Vibrio ruber]SJN57869.1 Arylsulfatase precursor [Vibrio ruber DSM 16370]